MQLRERTGKTLLTNKWKQIDNWKRMNIFFQTTLKYLQLKKKSLGSRAGKKQGKIIGSNWIQVNILSTKTGKSFSKININLKTISEKHFRYRILEVKKLSKIINFSLTWLSKLCRGKEGVFFQWQSDIRAAKDTLQLPYIVYYIIHPAKLTVLCELGDRVVINYWLSSYLALLL